MLKLHIEGEEGKVEYELFGMKMSDPIKYKNFRKEVDGKEVDAFCVVKTVQQELLCGKCNIKVNTDHHESCPICKTTFRSIMENNSKFNEGCDTKKAEMSTSMQKTYTEWLQKWCVECDVDFESITNGTYQG
jgi:hypothetical protein